MRKTLTPRLAHFLTGVQSFSGSQIPDRSFVVLLAFRTHRVTRLVANFTPILLAPVDLEVKRGSWLPLVVPPLLTWHGVLLVLILLLLPCILDHHLPQLDGQMVNYRLTQVADGACSREPYGHPCSRRPYGRLCGGRRPYSPTCSRKTYGRSPCSCRLYSRGPYNRSTCGRGLGIIGPCGRSPCIRSLRRFGPCSCGGDGHLSYVAELWSLRSYS